MQPVFLFIAAHYTCFISIHLMASCSVVNSTKANPRDAPTQDNHKNNQK